MVAYPTLVVCPAAFIVVVGELFAGEALSIVSEELPQRKNEDTLDEPKVALMVMLNAQCRKTRSPV